MAGKLLEQSWIGETGVTITTETTNLQVKKVASSEDSTLTTEYSTIDIPRLDSLGLQGKLGLQVNTIQHSLLYYLIWKKLNIFYSHTHGISTDNEI